jgi:hypothetical protein
MRTVRASGGMVAAAKNAPAEMTASATAHVPAATAVAAATVLREYSGRRKQQKRRGESCQGKPCQS